MTDTSMTMTTATEPDGAPRVASLDILRGLAILGILFMNINDMGGPLFAIFDGDPRHIGWSSADQVAWWLRELFASGTARCMLEMLFGVGMVILTDRAASALSSAGTESRLRRWAGKLFGPWAVLKSYYARNIILFLFGLAHIFILLWPGDILHTYGIAALVAFLFRRLGPKTLLALGLSMALLQMVGGGIGLSSAQRAMVSVPKLEAKRAAGGTLTAEETKAVEKFRKGEASRAKQLAEGRALITTENALRNPATGTAESWLRSAWHTTFYLWGIAGVFGEGNLLEPLFIWEAAATMLIGAALFKWGIIQGHRSRRFYLSGLLIAYLVGLITRGGIAWAITRFDDYPSLFFATSELGRLAMTLGHICAVHALLASARGARLLKPFEAAGRTALTIYICQTIICLWVLYPPFALALYGTQGWMALMLTALAVNAVLLVAANWYVTRYKIAPVEWAWRSIIARRMLSIRKGAGSLAGGSVPVAA